MKLSFYVVLVSNGRSQLLDPLKLTAQVAGLGGSHLPQVDDGAELELAKLRSYTVVEECQCSAAVQGTSQHDTSNALASSRSCFSSKVQETVPCLISPNAVNAARVKTNSAKASVSILNLHTA